MILQYYYNNIIIIIIHNIYIATVIGSLKYSCFILMNESKITLKAAILAGRKSCESCEMFFATLKQKVAYIKCRKEPFFKKLPCIKCRQESFWIKNGVLH